MGFSALFFARPRACTDQSIRIFCSSFSCAARAGISALSLHDALPISVQGLDINVFDFLRAGGRAEAIKFLGIEFAIGDSLARSEEHTSELQSRFELVCRLLLEKKKAEGDRKKKEERGQVEVGRGVELQ